MKLALCIVVLLSFGCLAAGEQARYDNYRIYRLSIENVQQLELLQEVERYPDGVSTFVMGLRRLSQLRVI